MTSTPADTIREAVRERYAGAAGRAASGAFDKARQIEAEATCCGPGSGCGGAADDADGSLGATLYGDEADGAPAAAVDASLGCGVPTAVARLHEGETVLDLGSGAGADVLISARRVGPSGRAIGLDMTDEMLELARRNAAEAGRRQRRVRQGLHRGDATRGRIGRRRDLELRDQPVGRQVPRPRRGGASPPARRPFAVSDIVADEDMDPATRADMQQWTGCIAGALTRAEFEGALADAGFVDIEIQETHRVHEQAGSAIVRARRAR